MKHTIHLKSGQSFDIDCENIITERNALGGLTSFAWEGVEPGGETIHYIEVELIAAITYTRPPARGAPDAS